MTIAASIERFGSRAMRLMTLALAAALLLATTLSTGSVAAKGRADIVGTAVAVNDATGWFDTLITAATCPYLGTTVTDILSSPDKTLFAPTDAAFRRLGQQLGLGKQGLNPHNVCDVDKLLGDGTLLTVLGYHVIDGRVSYKDAVKASGSKVTMLLGGKARITGTWWNLRIDGARIILPNLRASNGYIHVVNRVLNPLS
jgi:uncharacterized surface protein with fasciclin (FAS1) repeats